MLQLDNYVFKGRYEDVLGTAMIFQHDKGTKFSCQKIEFYSICHFLTSLCRKIASSQRPGCGWSQSRGNNWANKIQDLTKRSSFDHASHTPQLRSVYTNRVWNSIASIGRRLKYVCKTGKKLTMQRVFLKKEGEGMPPPIFKAPHATAEDKETSISPDTSAELEPGMSFF